MKLWIGTETQADVCDILRPIRNGICDAINAEIENEEYDIGVNDWDCIIVLQDRDSFEEWIRYSKVKRHMDFRLRLDYQQFVNGDSLVKSKLIVELLLRSLELLNNKTGCKSEIDRLSDKIRNLARRNSWM